jgi:DNA-binding CsgD family transcriptional regulator
MRRARESSSGILRVDVFAPDGTILYSDLVTLRGQAVSPVLDRRLGAALAGTASTRLDGLTSLEDADLKAQHPLAVESYVPFVVDGQVVGAYDLYQDPAPYQSLRLLVRALTAGLLLFALLLAGCAWLAGPARVAPAGEPRSSVGVVARERRLTRRELEVLRLMASDATYREIAEQLVLDEETVRSHAKRILQKLGQPDRKQAVAASQSQGLL